MNEVEMLALGDTLARTSEVLRPGEHVSFRDYFARVLRTEEQIAALSSIGGRGPLWTCSPGAWSGESA